MQSRWFMFFISLLNHDQFFVFVILIFIFSLIFLLIQILKPNVTRVAIEISTNSYSYLQSVNRIITSNQCTQMLSFHKRSKYCLKPAAKLWFSDRTANRMKTGMDSSSTKNKTAPRS